eukprot:CAMPEP_0174918126 /NCGR_PEP_ID=MMETSP1355-20121228/2893_1 /TAXON_ID=464990 /ORGANISM="Hemiselmis tepida, Strain CCMP443" /LENGTH=558 /DNA_ID=CAMNT_0016163285 /DNA_START=155 /DNA_END=1828 /DNA_ORIENTATION=+
MSKDSKKDVELGEAGQGGGSDEGIYVRQAAALEKGSSADAAAKRKDQRRYRAEQARVAVAPQDGPIKDRGTARELARQYRSRHMPRIPRKNLELYKGREDQSYPLNTPIFKKDRPSLADMGIGVSLYFETVQILTYVFVGMFVVCIPSIVLSLMANPSGAPDAGGGEGALAKMAIVTVAGIFRQPGSPYGCDTETCLFRDGSQLDTVTAVSIIVFADLGCCLILLTAVPLMRILFRRYAEAVDEGNVTAADYSVMVWGLPRRTTGKQVKDHFDRLLDRSFAAAGASKDGSGQPPGDLGAKGDPGPFEGVADVFLARADSRVLVQFAKRADLLRDRINVEAGLESPDLTEGEKRRRGQKVDRIAARIERLDQDIDGIDKTGTLNPVVCAFVIFNSQGAKIDALNKYVRKGGNGGMWGVIPPPHECLFEGKHRIRVTQAPEPSNIMWENLEASQLERLLRKAASSAGTALVVAVSFFAIVWGKSYQQAMVDNKGACSQASFAASCNANLDWDAVTPYGCPLGEAECPLRSSWLLTDPAQEYTVPLSIDTTNGEGVPVILS